MRPLRVRLSIYRVECFRRGRFETWEIIRFQFLDRYGPFSELAADLWRPGLNYANLDRFNVGEFREEPGGVAYALPIADGLDGLPSLFKIPDNKALCVPVFSVLLVKY